MIRVNFRTSVGMAALLALCFPACRTTTTSVSDGNPAGATGNSLTAAAASANGAQEMSAIKAVSLGSPSSFVPIYSQASPGSVAMARYFVGWDPEVMKDFKFTEDAAQARHTRIQQLEKELQKLPRGSSQALGLGTLLLHLYKSQAVYLEYIYAMGLKDPMYPNTAHFMKVHNSMVILHARRLIKEFNKVPQRVDWIADAIIARLRSEDPTAWRDATSYLKKIPNGAQSARIRFVAHAQYFGAKNQPKQLPAEFGTRDRLNDINTDLATRAAFALYAAEAMPDNNLEERKKTYLTAIKYGRYLRHPSGLESPIFRRAFEQLREIFYTASPTQVNDKLLDLLKHFGLFDDARNYVERIALNIRDKQPRQAIALYRDTLTFSDISDEIKTRVEFRCIDIALATKDLDALAIEWQKVLSERDPHSIAGIEERVESTQNHNRTTAEFGKEKGATQRYIKLHDFFKTRSKKYAINNQWEFTALELLQKYQVNGELVTRAEIFVKQLKNADERVRALRFAAMGKERQLGLPGTAPDWNDKRKLEQNAALATSYINTLRELLVESYKTEREPLFFQAAYMSERLEQKEQAHQFLRQGIEAFPSGKMAAEAMSFFITRARDNKDLKQEETHLRLAMEHSIQLNIPNDRRSAANMLEDNVHSSAESYLSAKDFRNAGAQFDAYAHEFSATARAPKALRMAADAYNETKNVEAARRSLEKLLENYPTSALCLEARWDAAKLAVALNDQTGAVRHFETFATQYPAEAIQRRAWEQAAELARAMGQLPQAIAYYEKQQNVTPAIPDKIDAAKKISLLAIETTNLERSLAELDRIVELKKTIDPAMAPDAHLWAFATKIKIHMTLRRYQEAQDLAQYCLSLEPFDEEGLRYQAEVNFMLGQMDKEKTENLVGEPNFIASHDEIMESYRKARERFLLVCEVPGSRWCAVAYHEISTLAGAIGKAFAGASFPQVTDGQTSPFRDAIQSYAEPLNNDKAIYERTAQEALQLHGAPSPEYEKKIRGGNSAGTAKSASPSEDSGATEMTALQES